MDNLTHSLTGLVIGKAGLERLSPSATTVCVIAANAPDFDFLTLLFGGRWAYLHHHRGITHSLIGTLLLIILVPSLFYVGGFVLARIRKRPNRLHYSGLLLASLIAGATHPLMDWANNYGIRLLLPWSSRWFYGDLVFIIDPLLWVALGGAAFLLTSKTKAQIIFWSALALILTGSVLFLPQQPESPSHLIAFRIAWVIVIAALLLARRAALGVRFKSSLAVAALAFVIMYWGGLGIAHHYAYQNAFKVANQLATFRGEAIIQVAAMPMLADPLHWQCIAETDRATYRFNVSLKDKLKYPLSGERFEKPKAGEQRAISVAAQDHRAKVFLGFARFPAAQVKDLDCVSQTVVQFADLRYTEPGGGRRGVFALDVPIACPAPMEKIELK